jgi:hypothetical protein
VNSPYEAKTSRRVTLQWLAAATILPSLRLRLMAKTPASGTKGYGTDPNLLAPVVPWTKTMTSHQLRVTAALADLILPGSKNTPSPSALGIPDFIDEWISAPYPDQRSDRKVILAGLTWVDSEAMRQRGAGFIEIDDNDRREILDKMARDHSDTVSKNARTFFRRLRFLVAGAYYTTPEGLKDIGYRGNVALTSYPPITDEELAILEGELRELGI